MGIITDMSTQKKRDTRVNLYMDGRFCCGLEKITVFNENINIGDEISCERLAEIQEESESAVAFDKAVKFLSIRMRSEKEMRTNLEEKGFLPSVIDSVIVKLKGYKYVDDESYARCYIESARYRYGANRIAQELKFRGVDAFIIEDALAEIDDQFDEALCVAKAFIRTHSDVSYKKLSAHLYAKGFKYDTMKNVMAEVKEDLVSG